MANQFPTNLNQAVDLALDENGDLMIGPDGDFVKVYGLDAFIQEVVFRLKTRKGDYRLQPSCGASLDTLIGQPMSPATASLAQSLIISALTHDGFLDTTAVTTEVDPGPAGSTAMTIIIQIDLSTKFQQSSLPSQGSILNIPVTIDPQEGLLL